MRAEESLDALNEPALQVLLVPKALLCNHCLSLSTLLKSPVAIDAHMIGEPGRGTGLGQGLGGVKWCLPESFIGLVSSDVNVLAGEQLHHLSPTRTCVMYM